MVRAAAKALKVAPVMPLVGFTSNALVSEARRYMGTNPTGRGRQWCGAFLDMVLKKTGHAGGGNLARAMRAMAPAFRDPRSAPSL